MDSSKPTISELAAQLNGLEPLCVEEVQLMANELGLWSSGAFLRLLILRLSNRVTWSQLLNFSVPVSSSVNESKNSTHLIGSLQGLSELTRKGLRRAPGTTVKVR